jgi:hypothetical protein
VRFDGTVVKNSVHHFAMPRLSRASFVVLLTVLAAVGCEQKAKKIVTPEGPKVKATVVTIRTVLQPSNKAFNHSLIIVNGIARSGDEVDVWHLYDPKRARVTTVDEVAKTHRVDPVTALVAARVKQEAAGNVASLSTAKLVTTDDSIVHLGAQTRRWLLTAGAYKRDLWFGTHPAIPAGLFSAIYATRLAESTAAGVSAAVDRQLMAVNEFPFIDRSELPYGKSTMTVERTVTKIEEKEVPQAWLEIPKGSRDVTPQPARKAR